jgi:RIO kinase 1
LKDAVFNDTKAEELYFQMVKIMRKLYQECHLIHADLSEYNLLFFKGLVYVIDVSQSVEHDHPHALEFLRTDCVNVNAFFSRRGARVLRLRDLFEYVTAKHLPVNDVSNDAYLLALIESASTDGSSTTAAADEAVFKQTFIPRNLNEVVNLDKELRAVNSGGADDLVYRSVAGVIGSAQPAVDGFHDVDNRKADMLSRVLGVNLQQQACSSTVDDYYNDEEYYSSDDDNLAAATETEDEDETDDENEGEDEGNESSDSSSDDGSSSSGRIRHKQQDDPEELRKAKKVTQRSCVFILYL